METITFDSALPTLETPLPELPDGSTLEDAAETVTKEVEREEKIAGKLADLRTEMRPPGERTGDLTESEDMARELIRHTMSTPAGARYAQRMRAALVAKRLTTHIDGLRAEHEASK